MSNTPPDSWKPEELDLRRREVSVAVSTAKSQTWLLRFQLFSTAISIAAVTVAALAAYAGFKAVRQSEASNTQQTQNDVTQAEENQVSTAVSALGSDDSAERIAGLLLLRINAINEMTPRPGSPVGREKAYNNYVMSILVFQFYINNYSLGFLKRNAGFGLGYGAPPPPGLPLDVSQAADEINILLSERRVVEALGGGIAPSLDLAHDELFEQDWKGVNFSWLAGKFFAGIDLRGADLLSSGWRRSYLVGAHLQCADLAHADLRGADLQNADLRGADIQGANFRGADLLGAQLGDVYGKAKGHVPEGKSITTPQQASMWQENKSNCLSKFTDNSPKSAS